MIGRQLGQKPLVGPFFLFFPAGQERRGTANNWIRGGVRLSKTTFEGWGYTEMQVPSVAACPYWLEKSRVVLPWRDGCNASANISLQRQSSWSNAFRSTSTVNVHQVFLLHGKMRWMHACASDLRRRGRRLSSGVLPVALTLPKKVAHGCRGWQ